MLIKRTLTYNGIVLEINDNTSITDMATTDIDGNIYNSVQIGTQEWLVQNLKTTRYKDGTPITHIDGSLLWSLDTSGAYCWYDNCIGYKEPYGALYNWYVVNSSHGLAPEGWRIPTLADVTILSNYISGGYNPQSVYGGKLKEVGLDHWFTPNGWATDDYGFKGLGSGMREYAGWAGGFQFMDITGYSYNFVSDDQDPSARSFGFNYDSSAIANWAFPKNHGQSVRCIKIT